MPDTSFDPRPAHLSGPTRCGSGPEAWAGSGDLPDTQAEPVPVVIFRVPKHWSQHTEHMATIEVLRQELPAVDFYRGRP